jgi:hypothetical protein
VQLGAAFEKPRTGVGAGRLKSNNHLFGSLNRDLVERVTF